MPAMSPTGADVESFLAAIPDDRRREDARALCAVMAEATGEPAAMWGSSIVGFGRYHYRYDSGHEGDAADDDIAAYVAEHPDARVVTSDAGLARRVREAGAEVVGARWLLDQLG